MGKRVRLVGDAPRWTEARIASMLANGLLNGRSALVVPNCGWTGSECDLLVVEPGKLRIIDVEIKISRADLRADLKKDKWWKSRPWSRKNLRSDGSIERDRREWPEKVWKHYYALPETIWTDALLDSVPANSGILLLQERKGNRLSFWMRRRAKPNSDAKPITPADAVDIARLASLRMWNALNKGEQR